MYHVASQIAYIVSAKAMISLIPVMEIAWAADMNEDRQKVSWRHFGCDIDVRHLGKQLPFHWSNSTPVSDSFWSSFNKRYHSIWYDYKWIYRCFYYTILYDLPWTSAKIQSIILRNSKGQTRWPLGASAWRLPDLRRSMVKIRCLDWRIFFVSCSKSTLWSRYFMIFPSTFSVAYHKSIYIINQTVWNFCCFVVLVSNYTRPKKHNKTTSSPRVEFKKLQG